MEFKTVIVGQVESLGWLTQYSYKINVAVCCIYYMFFKVCQPHHIIPPPPPPPTISHLSTTVKIQ